MMAKKEIKDNELIKLSQKWMAKFPPSYLGYISSSSVGYDYLFDGGFPLGKIGGLWSPPGVGKSLIAMFVIKGILDNDPESVALYIDAEFSVDKKILGDMGYLKEGWQDILRKIKVTGKEVELNELLKPEYRGRFILVTIDTYEDADAVISEYADARKFGGGLRLRIVAIDSFTELQPRAIVEEESHQIAAKAGADVLFCHRIKSMANLNHFGILVVVQEGSNFTTKKGPASRYAPATKAKGSRAFLHALHYLYVVKVTETIKDVRGNKVGAWVQLSSSGLAEKNKIAGNRSVKLCLKYGYGISNIQTIIGMLKWVGLVVKAGTYFTLRHETMDFGEGVGAPVTVQGNSNLEELVSRVFGMVMDYCLQSGKMEEYFNSSDE
jgi:RecA/RadA recombinase